MGGKLTGGRNLPLVEAQDLAYSIIDDLHRVDSSLIIQVAGSVRRNKPVVGDIDIVTTDSPALQSWLENKFGLQENGSPKKSGLIDGVQVDFLITNLESYGAALMHFTGPKHRNINQRKKAQMNGWILNEKGLWNGKGEMLAGKNEAEIYLKLGLDWRDPEKR